MRRKAMRIATRGSELALFQAREVCRRLLEVGVTGEIVEISTRGDRERGALSEIGGAGVFTKALEEAVLEGRADAAVHSAKDLPTQLVYGLGLVAALPRGDARDVLCSAGGMRLAELAAGAVLGTSSARRRAAVLRMRGDVAVRGIRGNVPTRLEKVRRGEYTGVVLAAAGLRRLGLAGRISEVFDVEAMLPAAGQGVIVVEARAEGEAAEVFGEMSDGAAFSCVSAERAVLRELRAGCRAAVGAYAEAVGGEYRLKAGVLSVDGTSEWRAEAVFGQGGEEAAGAQVARELVESGAGEALDAAGGS